MKTNVCVLLIIILVCSCKNKNNMDDNMIQNNYIQSFIEMNNDKPEMIYSVDYYKDEIIKLRNMFDERQYISNIVEVKDFFPGLLSFIVSWNDQLKGYMYELYTFNEKHKIAANYLVGYGPLLNSYRDVLMEKLPGNKIGNELLAIGDFNNDGINEILSYSFYTNMGYVFTVFGYNEYENDIIHLCLVPIFINFEKPFPPVEYIENGFKIFEIIDNEPLEFSWNNYIWDSNFIKYLHRKFPDGGFTPKPPSGSPDSPNPSSAGFSPVPDLLDN